MSDTIGECGCCDGTKWASALKVWWGWGGHTLGPAVKRHRRWRSLTISTQADGVVVTFSYDRKHGYVTATNVKLDSWDRPIWTWGTADGGNGYILNALDSDVVESETVRVVSWNSPANWMRFELSDPYTFDEFYGDTQFILDSLPSDHWTDIAADYERIYKYNNCTDWGIWNWDYTTGFVLPCSVLTLPAVPAAVIGHPDPDGYHWSEGIQGGLSERHMDYTSLVLTDVRNVNAAGNFCEETARWVDTVVTRSCEHVSHVESTWVSVHPYIFESDDRAEKKYCAADASWNCPGCDCTGEKFDANSVHIGADDITKDADEDELP